MSEENTELNGVWWREKTFHAFKGRMAPRLNRELQLKVKTQVVLPTSPFVDHPYDRPQGTHQGTLFCAMMLCGNCGKSTQNLVWGNSATLGPFESAASLEAEMIQIEQAMESLRQRRTMIRRKINALSPTAQLPPEILTEIFRLVCQPHGATTEQPIPPLLFGGICREWRTIAWSTPLLWNTVTLHISRKMHGSQVHLLRDWLLRAQSSPLYIKLTTDDEHESIFCSLRAIMDVLVTRSTYWYSLDCLLPPQCHDVLKNNQFPMLTSVSIRPPKGTISTFSEPPNIFLAAPKLLDVDLSGYNFAAMVLPWEQLRKFKTQFLTVGECLKVFRRSPDLKECHLESVYSPDLLSSPTLNPLHCELEYLDVTLIKGAAISLLDNITLPSLRDLRICYSGPNGFLLSSISSLVLRSACDLQRLHIRKQYFRDEDLLPCLEAIPSLSYLHLTAIADYQSGLTQGMVEGLNPSVQRGRPLLPNLKYFEFCGPMSAQVGSVIAMLSARWNGSRGVLGGNSDMNGFPLMPLKTLKIIWPGRIPISDDGESEISRLSGEGISFLIEHPNNTSLMQ
ncbi:hypothetical protein CVT26_002300 [Gymnopilus dilepis]|uniref:Uncharacterized protein n=1 Tax=Gymnopilus dilepis TaxID=231916 RepID=A0A409WEA7_9AGAR|nr:hypothetical protein CVT26_002300 [Gymnopilus dilepis]